MKFFIVFFITVMAVEAFAYPQMIRHGYTNCMTCHVSPRGGGLLTEYGRALSKEVLSTWGYEGEQNWHYGAFEKTPKWLQVGGDFRAVQVHSKTEQATIGRFIEMQEQVEVAVKHKGMLINVTAASDTLKESKPWGVPRFYLLNSVTDHLNFRIGRFTPRFGINMPEHVFSTRGPLGFGIQSEREAFELAYIESQWDVSLALTSGKKSDQTEAAGVYAQANYSIGTHDRLGMSFEKKSKDDKAFSVGMHGLIGLSEKLYLLTETVYRESQPTPTNQREGLFHFSKIGYELEKGFHVVAIGDIQKANLSSDSTTASMYGAGFTFFPRPHFEFQGILAKRKLLSRSQKEGDYAWLMMHFYL